MIKSIALENFKPFREKQEISIKPITLIFGANSSGKSSILQSILLMKQSIEESTDPNVVLIPNGKLVKLGSFREIVHRNEIKNSFSFKITTSVPEDVYIHANLQEITYDNPNDEIMKLGKILNKYNSMSIRITFSYNKEHGNIFISEMGLFLEDDNHPIIIYKSSELELRCNEIDFNHHFWKIYWEILDKDNKETEEEFKAIIYKYNLSRFIEYIEDSIKKAKASSKEQEICLNIEEEWKSYKKILLNSNCYEQAIEIYKIIHSDNKIGLQNFLPFELNNEDMERITDDWGWFPIARNISIFFLTMADLIKHFLGKIVYLNSLRISPERSYIDYGHIPNNVDASGTNFPQILLDESLLNKVNTQLNNFNLGHEIIISKITEPNSESSERFVLRLSDKLINVNPNICDVGFGISQVLPVVVQSLKSKNEVLLIEEPEQHLHPAVQAELGSLFAMCIKPPFNNHFIIETHSEHLILRLQKLIRKKELKPEDISVIYVEKNVDGSRCLELRLDEDGDFIDNWPNGFFEEGYREMFD